MKIWLLLLVASSMLVGCYQSSDTIPVSSSPIQTDQSKQITKASPSTQASPLKTSNDKQTTLPETPQKTCGDPLPKDGTTSPVSFYPIFVAYSEKNLELVKKHFCEDAFKYVREKTGKDVIQVGSFTSLEKANQFKQKISQHFKGADIGDPTIVEGTGQPKAFRKDVIQAARLTPEQVDQLDTKVGTGNDFAKGSVVVIPTYVPDDFQIVDFRVSSYDFRRFFGRKALNNYKQDFAGIYDISYASAEGYCFSITGGAMTPVGDSPSNFSKIIKLATPALGDVEIGYDVFDKGDEIRSIGLHYYKIGRGSNEYQFSFTNSSSGRATCKIMKLKDAIRIVQSLQFMNP